MNFFGNGNCGCNSSCDCLWYIILISLLCNCGCSNGCGYDDCHKGGNGIDCCTLIILFLIFGCCNKCK